MELRLLEFAFRLLDPRKFRTRLKQLGAFFGFGMFVWIRSVFLTDRARAERKRQQARRQLRIKEHLEGNVQPPPTTVAEVLEQRV